MISATSTSTVVPIQGIFDIAMARNTLRTKIAQQRWPMVFNARAATALSALCELILALDQSQAIIIQIETIREVKKCGIRLSSQFRILDKKPAQWEERKRNLERAAADTEIQESGNEIEITTCVWVE